MRSRDFWNWFESHAEQLAREAMADASVRDAAGVLSELDRRLTRLEPGIGWEVGPYKDGWCLVLSPVEAAREPALTPSLLEAAPKIGGWTFLAARPAKFWRRQFQYCGLDVDARCWRYQLRRWEDGALGIIWGLMEWLPDQEADLEDIGWFVLEAEVGEEMARAHFVDVEVTDLSTWSDPHAGNPIGDLKAHVTAMGAVRST